MMIIIARQFSH